MYDKIYNIIEEDVTPIKLKEEKYYYNNIPVPRVTEIISKMISEDYLLYWANSLGFKKQGYKKTVQAAADIGSETHDLISRFLLGETFTSNNIPYLAFRKWWIEVSSNNSVSVLGSEVQLTCPYFGGTYDLSNCYVKAKNTVSLKKDLKLTKLANPPKYIVIDEITHFNTVELLILSEFCKLHKSSCRKNTK